MKILDNIKLIFEGMIDTIEDGKASSVRYFDNWTAHVKNTVPPEKLLIFDSKHGWEPLCSFLGVPIPDEPYPRANDSNVKQKQYKRGKYLSFLVVIIFPVLLSFFLFRKYGCEEISIECLNQMYY